MGSAQLRVPSSSSSVQHSPVLESVLSELRSTWTSPRPGSSVVVHTSSSASGSSPGRGLLRLGRPGRRVEPRPPRGPPSRPGSGAERSLLSNARRRAEALRRAHRNRKCRTPHGRGPGGSPGRRDSTGTTSGNAAAPHCRRHGHRRPDDDRRCDANPLRVLHVSAASPIGARWIWRLEGGFGGLGQGFGGLDP